MADTFLVKFLNGKATAGEIDDYIATWHESASDLPLHAYLGMSEAAYAAWVIDASTLESLRRERAPKDLA